MNSSRHKEWRKLVKKLRRKRIRQQLAKERKEILLKSELERRQSPSYEEWLIDTKKHEEFLELEEKRLHDEREAKWIETEKFAQEQWAKLQLKLAKQREERAKQNVRIREEWERELKRLNEIEEKKKKAIEEKLKEQSILKEQIDKYIENGGDIPEQLQVKFETNPNKTLCPFFSKISACRFGDVCSRNHIRPGMSKIILIPNFYNHFSFFQPNEHGDSILEFDNSEVYEHFKEFFFDVVPEMEKCGKIEKFIVCCNTEPHLRGNVYVEYSSEREAVRSFKIFNGRFYGGKQLSVEFCEIPSWKSAICGLFHRQKCPKGSSCNFIHIFTNPKKLYSGFNKFTSKVIMKNSERNWRWSESPEKEEKNLLEWEYRIEKPENHEPRSKSPRRKRGKSERSHSKSKRSHGFHSSRSREYSERRKRR